MTSNESPTTTRNEESGPHLTTPVNKKSKYWQYYSQYDLSHHPDKKDIGRCNLCGQDLTVKQGTGSLSGHLKYKHPDEYKSLQEESEEVPPAADDNLGCPTAMHQPTNNRMPQDVTSRTNLEKSMKKKNDFEIWAAVRRELKDLKLELEEKEIDNDNTDVVELEQDIKNLKMMKAELCALLFRK